MLQINCYRKLLVLLWIIALCISHPVFSQLDGKKNTVKVNITNPIIFGSRAFIFGFERMIGKNHSVNFGIGRMSLPAFSFGSSGDSISLDKNSGENGFHISADYRFYLKKENKYEAPRGVFIGPYYSYNHFSRSNKWKMNTTSYQGEVNTDLAIGIHTIGAELGYQFVLWKKLSIDMVLAGPGIGFYQLKADVNTVLSEGDKELFYQHLNDLLKEKIPGYNLALSDGEFKKNGSLKTTAFGYRYLVNLGFRF